PSRAPGRARAARRWTAAGRPPPAPPARRGVPSRARARRSARGPAATPSHLTEVRSEKREVRKWRAPRSSFSFLVSRFSLLVSRHRGGAVARGGEFAHCAQQLALLERLDQVGRDAQVERLAAVLLARARGQHDDRQVAV